MDLQACSGVDSSGESTLPVVRQDVDYARPSPLRNSVGSVSSVVINRSSMIRGAAKDSWKLERHPSEEGARCGGWIQENECSILPGSLRALAGLQRSDPEFPRLQPVCDPKI